MTFTPHPKVLGFLEQLRDCGLYGRTVADVADRLICQQIQRAIETGLVHVEGSTDGKKTRQG